MTKSGPFVPEALPAEVTKEQALSLRDIVTDSYLLNSAVGLNPDMQPG